MVQLCQPGMAQRVTKKGVLFILLLIINFNSIRKLLSLYKYIFYLPLYYIIWENEVGKGKKLVLDCASAAVHGRCSSCRGSLQILRLENHLWRYTSSWCPPTGIFTTYKILVCEFCKNNLILFGRWTGNSHKWPISGSWYIQRYKWQPYHQRP